MGVFYPEIIKIWENKKVLSDSIFGRILRKDYKHFSLKKGGFSMENYNTFLDDVQLEKNTFKPKLDKNGEKKKRDWAGKKKNSLLLAESYKRLGKEKRAMKVFNCAKELIFKECTNHGYRILSRANFCKDILCPVCSWRRSHINRGQLYKIIPEIYKLHPDVRFLFLTISRKNVSGEQLKDEITHYNKSFERFFKRSEIKNNPSILGYVKALEVTRNLDPKSKDYNTFHPHFHIMIAVKGSYFTRYRIHHSKYESLWAESVRVDYRPVVHICTVKNKVIDNKINYEEQEISELNAILETAKYAVKGSDYILKDTLLMDEGVDVFTGALDKRNMISYGGIFKTIKKELKLADVMSDNVDLVGESHKDCKCPICQTELKSVLYQFNLGYREYVRKDF